MGGICVVGFFCFLLNGVSTNVLRLGTITGQLLKTSVTLNNF